MSITTYTPDDGTPSRARLSPEDRAHLERLQFRFRSGRLCLDFVATAGGRGHYGYLERLRRDDDLGLWLVAAGLHVSPPEVEAHEFQGSLELRQAIYRLATRGPNAPARRDVAAVSRWAEHPPLVPTLKHSGPGLQVTMSGDVTAALSTIARDAIDLFAGPYAARVRQCAGDGCILLFVDTSRPGKRRWCAMSACGTVANASAYRRRRGGAPADPGPPSPSVS
jgi:predicted RNA-binding Zn ribbon-like protein